MIRLGVIGAASSGKSALCNALFGSRFLVDARAGSTKHAQSAIVHWSGRDLHIIDAPADTRVSADAYLLVSDKDLTESEGRAAHEITRPLGVVLNKIDLYTGPQRRQLLAHIRKRLMGVVPPERVVVCAAEPLRVVQQADGMHYLPAEPHLADVSTLVETLVADAERSARVRVREFAGSLFRR